LCFRNTNKLGAMITKKKRIYMWYKVKELKGDGLNNSQISRELGLDRSTVSKYLSIGEDEYHNRIEQGRNLPRKLSDYLGYVKNELSLKPYLSAAQIEDRLKERYANLPQVHSKTVYNFVQQVRKQYDIAKPKRESHRDFEQLPETDYGRQAQVDFGESYLQTHDKTRVKVYFFAIVLSRSRYKYVYLQDRPFTTSDAVYAHLLAFEYYQGIPREILYDQDKVFIHNENLGDYLLTHEFKAFSQSQPFEVIFCRKADPQSKGKVENVVGYVKKNFLRGREFTSITHLNQEVLGWLSRTGNAKVHGSTRKVPSLEWQIEKQSLHPLMDKAIKPETNLSSCNVRKDNTITYEGNFYTLPLGTYKGHKTTVQLSRDGDYLNLYALDKTLLATHEISSKKGGLIRNSDHAREKSKSCAEKHQQVYQLFGSNEKANLYLELLRKDKPRYYHDNLRAIIKGTEDIGEEFISESLDFCLENGVYNGADFSQIAMKYQQADLQKNSPVINIAIQATAGNHTAGNNPDENLQTSNIKTYENIIETWNE